MNLWSSMPLGTWNLLLDDEIIYVGTVVVAWNYLLKIRNVDDDKLTSRIELDKGILNRSICDCRVFVRINREKDVPISSKVI